MKHTGIFLSVALVAAVFVQTWHAGEASAQTHSERHVVLILDRSGSMQAARSGGTTSATRWEEAVDRSIDFVNLPYPLTTYWSIWTFEGSSYTVEQAFTTSKANTVNKLNSLRVGNDLTPLAYALCDAVDYINSYRPSADAEKVIRLASDGEENNTPRGTQCQGPDSAGTYPNLDRGSWQWKVRNMMRNGDPNNPTSGPFPLVFDVDVFYNYVSFTGADSADRERRMDDELNQVPAQLSTNYFEFLKGLSTDTGGSFIPMADTAPAPVMGDVTGDYCVDSRDYDRVVYYYGQTVPPAPAAADINRDGVIDYYDLSIVQNHLGEGEGCGSPS